MTIFNPRSRRGRQIAIVAALLGLIALLLVPAGALAAGTRVVSYRGVEVTVPTAWPVFRLGANSTVCVRFNRHAVYLGTPGVRERCPLHAVGRTEALLIAPRGGGAAGLASASVLGAAPVGGSMARLVEARHHVVVTATWNRDPGVIRTALGRRSLRTAMLATNGHRPRLARAAAAAPHRLGLSVSSAAPALPGQVYTGLGFDTCTTQPQATMSAWAAASPFGAVGVYIGGTNAACIGGNLTAPWVQAESAAGWHLIPIYVGLQAPGNGCGCSSITSSQAAAQGTAAALDAVAHAQALGIGVGNPIYFDMENYSRGAAASAAVLAFLQGWTVQLHVSGYRSGVYASGSSGITDLVAQQGTGYVEPDEIWIADWNAAQTTSDPYVPTADWVDHQRLHQYAGASSEKYGGAAVSVDSDYVDASTAAYGSGTAVAAAGPTLKLKPQVDGSVDVTPRWVGEPGVARYDVLAGRSATTLTLIQTVTPTHRFPLNVEGVYGYFEVQALSASGQVLGGSAPEPTPPSVAIFGRSAFVPAHGSLAIPVACPNTTSCRVQASIYDGRQRLTHSATVQSVSRRGTLVGLPLTKRLSRLVAAAPGRRLPVSVSVASSEGTRASRTIDLIPYTTAGSPPARSVLSSSTIHILGKTSFVSDGWVGGVLAACASTAPCVAVMRVTTPAGGLLATARTQSVGVGELAYLTYTMTNHGHALLERSRGNQLAARIVVSTAAPVSGAGAPVTRGGSAASALVSLDAFR